MGKRYNDLQSEYTELPVGDFIEIPECDIYNIKCLNLNEMSVHNKEKILNKNVTKLVRPFLNS